MVQNTEINSKMRKGTILHFSKVLEAIKFVQTGFPDVKLTVRTVVAEPNVDFVHLIGETLKENGIKPRKNALETLPSKSSWPKKR